MPWVDLLVGIALAIGLLFVFYLIDRTFVYRKPRLGFWTHLKTTAFFPKRIIAYLMVWLVILMLLKPLMESLPVGTLSYNLVEAIFRLSIYPFLGLCMLIVVVTLKTVIFPTDKDSDGSIL